MRLIDADALLEQIFCTTNTENNIGLLMLLTGLVNDAPTIDRWISAKDRPPERPDWYLVYAPDYQEGSSSQKEQHKGVMFAKWTGKLWSIERCYYNRPNVVIAWRDISEPLTDCQ